MNLKNTLLGVAMLASAGFLTGCGSDVEYNTVASLGVYTTAIEKQTSKTTEDLLLRVKDKYDLTDKSQMSVFYSLWSSLLKQEPTLHKQKEMQTLYNAGLVWTAQAQLDVNDVFRWLMIERDVAAAGLNITPLSINVVNRAMDYTTWNLQKRTADKNYRYGYNSLDNLLLTNARACRVRNIYPQVDVQYQKLKSVLEGLNGTLALAKHNDRGRYNQADHDRLYTVPFQTLECAQDAPLL